MTKRWGTAVAAFGLVLATTDVGRADDAAARATVDKAVQALGGEAKLAKFKAATGKLKGTFHGLGAPLAFTGETAYQGPDQERFALEATVDGEKLVFISVLNRDKGWTKLNDDVDEMGKDELADAQEEAYANWVTTLLPLKDKEFKLTSLGESKVESRSVLGVKVSRKGRRDVKLHFDKETGLPVKVEARVKDDDTGMEVTEETLLSDYKEIEGTKHPMKFTVRRDGKVYLEAELSDYKPVEKLDDNVFAKP
jgi:outer membrane lipoprotein-sorting protein